jgi:hypothetical protein
MINTFNGVPTILNDDGKLKIVMDKNYIMPMKGNYVYPVPTPPITDSEKVNLFC